MISNAQLEMIAARYGIGLSYREEGAGGFIEDETGKIKKSVVGDIGISLNGRKDYNKETVEYAINDDMALFAA